MKRWFLLLLCLSEFSLTLYSQIITTDPAYPTTSDSITLIYNAKLGNGDLAGYTGNVYVYTGLITTNSTDSHDWKDVVGGWGDHTSTTLMKRIGTDLYQISFKISKFYNINPDSTQVLDLALLFRSADNSLVGRGTGGADIFYPINMVPAGDFQSYETKNGALNINSTQGTLTIKPYTAKDIKVSYLPDSMAAPDTSYTVVLNPASVPFSVKNNSNSLEMNTSALEVYIQKNPLRLKFIKNQDTLLAENTGIYSQFGQEGLSLKMGSDEAYYGTGSRSLPINRRGYDLQMYNQAHYGYDSGTVNLNIAIPVVVSSKGYLLYFDNHSPGDLNLGSNGSNNLDYQSETGPLSYFFMAGDNNDSLLSQYTELTGKQPLPPMWALGYIQSKYGYQNVSQATNVVNSMKSFGIPMDAIVLDLYWYGQASEMGNLDWDYSSFPNPTKMMSDFAAEGVKTILITEPYFTTQSTEYATLSSQKYFALNSSGDTYVLNGFWAGAAALLDLTKPHSFDWMWSRYEALTKEGVSGWWCDLGEPEDEPSDMVLYKGTARETHNLYSLIWAGDIKRGFEKYFPEKRLFDLIRSGYAGMQRFSTFPWSGDTQRSWTSLHGQIPLILGMGMSGVGYMCTDIGGFTGNGQNDELYTRWMQFGAFTPIMRAHGVGVPTEPYNYPEPYLDVLRKFIKLRYELLPYNYTLTWMNHLTGRPLAMPLNYFDPQNPKLQNISDEYFWGENFLVAPVTKSGATSRSLFLPAGKWINFWNDQIMDGNQQVTVPAPLDEMPLFVKAGSFIPTALNLPNTAAYNGDSLQILYYPDVSVNESNFTLYNDDGKTPGAWKKGEYQLIDFAGNVSSKQIQVILNSKGNGYTGMPSSRVMIFQIQRVTSLPSAVSLDGNNIPLSSTESGYKNDSTGAFWDSGQQILKVHFAYRGGHDTLLIKDAVLGVHSFPAPNITPFKLLNPEPQPFTAQVRIPVIISKPGDYKLQIYNLEGKLLVQMESNFSQKGENEFFWNGTSESGNNLPGGIYIAVVKDSKGNKAHTKLVKIKGR